MADNRRHTPFTLADLARVRSSGQRQIQAIHSNQCPLLAQAGACTCGERLSFRLVNAKKARVQR